MRQDKPADLDTLVQTVKEALEVLQRSRTRFRCARKGWKVYITLLNHKKRVVSIWVRDPHMYKRLTDWLEAHKIAFESVKRFGGRDSKDRLRILP